MSVFRSKRRKAEREARKIKQSEAFNIVNSIKQLREAGVIQIDYHTFQVKVVRKLFWDERDDDFLNNFITKLHGYLDGITGNDPASKDYKPKTLQLHDLETDELLTTHETSNP